MNELRIFRCFLTTILFAISFVPVIADEWATPGNLPVTKVTHASVSKNGEILSLCLLLWQPGTRKIIPATLTVPLTKQDKWEIKRVASKTIKGVLKKARTNIYYKPDLSNLKAGCNPDKKTIDLIILDELKFRKKVRASSHENVLKLKKGVNEAVYVTMIYSKNPNIAYYVSSKPVFEKEHIISTFLQSQFRYTGSLCQKQTLIKDKFDQNDIRAIDSNNNTQLHCAAFDNNVDKIKLLLSKGLDKDALTNDDATPLMMAARFGNLEAVKLLIEHNADVNLVSSSGGSALLAAARFGYTDIVKILLANGADKDISDDEGLSPYMWAKMKKHYEIMELLK